MDQIEDLREKIQFLSLPEVYQLWRPAQKALARLKPKLVCKSMAKMP